MCTIYSILVEDKSNRMTGGEFSAKRDARKGEERDQGL
jgi:hypothetical protein